MFYRFYVLADSGSCSTFDDPLYKSDVFSSRSLAEVYIKFSYFLQDYSHFQFPSQFLKPDRVYIVYGEDPKVCPYRPSNKRFLVFSFNHLGFGGNYRTLGCDFL